MVKFSQRQMNTLIDALGNFYIATTKFCMSGTVDSLNNYRREEQYLNGVLDALSIKVVEDSCGYKERYHIYPSEVCKATLTDSGNKIEIMTIDALEKKVIYDISKDNSYYGIRYSKQLEDGLKKYYREVYNEII